MLINTKQTAKTITALKKIAKKKGTLLTRLPDGNFVYNGRNLLDLMEMVRKAGGQLRG